jgi:hypothetical protein
MDEPKKDEPKKGKMYWGVEEEKAVVNYLMMRQSGSSEIDLYFQKNLYKPIKKLVENIMFTYRLGIPGENITEQIHDCIGFVVYKMDRFTLGRTTKAFSYYGTVAKNYLIAKKNKNNKKIKEYVDIDEIIGFEHENNICVENGFESDMKSLSFLVSTTANDIEYILENDLTIDKNTYRLGEAIVTLLKNYQDINIQHKRQFYFIAREITGLSAKEITRSLQRFKEIFKDLNRDFL